MRKTLQRSHNTPKRLPYQLSLPIDIGELIGTEESVNTVLEITERMDYNLLHATYERLPGASEVSPKQLFQLVTQGFMEEIYSTRKLESASRYDIRFMRILQGKPAPDHNLFWRFIKHRLQGEVIEHLFYQLVDYLLDAGEIDLANLFVDGTKIEACANRYTFVWKKSTNKYEARLDGKMADFVSELTARYLEELPTGTGADACLEILTDLAKRKGITFVHGRGKRKSQLQRDIETLSSYVQRKRKYEGYNETFEGRNSFSKTDPDATFMRMKDDHMLNGQLKPGYNLQIGVTGEYIVGVDISSERSDQQTLIPLLDRMEAGMKGKRFENIVADAGYESEENYKALESRNQAAFIKPQNYEKSKTRKYKTNAYLRENMPYDPEADTYTCPAGNPFAPLYTTVRRSTSGFESTVTVYECQGCNTCPQKKDCTRSKGNRRISVSKDFIGLREQARERIITDQGKVLRLNRSIQAEGAFGVMKEDYGFRRFARRGKENVYTETLLHAIAYNMNKLHNKKKRQLANIILHMPKTA